jgi:hypothetical protein
VSGTDRLYIKIMLWMHENCLELICEIALKGIPQKKEIIFDNKNALATLIILKRKKSFRRVAVWSCAKIYRLHVAACGGSLD